jgi:hypothetical protein
LRCTAAWRGIIEAVSISIGVLIGFFLGFAFGVGCALAVMYSIYLGGYRAAVRDAGLPESPPRLVKARAKAAAGSR